MKTRIGRMLLAVIGLFLFCALALQAHAATITVTNTNDSGPGDPNFTPPPVYDQRGPGFYRERDLRIDIGSFEVQAGFGPRPRPTPHPRPTPRQANKQAAIGFLSARLWGFGFTTPFAVVFCLFSQPLKLFFELLQLFIGEIFEID